jgi:hypothetical protein
MSHVISFTEHRNARIRERVLSFALRGETVIIETRAGLVRSERILCHAHAVEIRNSLGATVQVDYQDIRSVRAASTPQISAVSASGDWILPKDATAQPEPSRVLAFARRARRS